MRNKPGEAGDWSPDAAWRRAQEALAADDETEQTGDEAEKAGASPTRVERARAELEKFAVLNARYLMGLIHGGGLAGLDRDGLATARFAADVCFKALHVLGLKSAGDSPSDDGLAEVLERWRARRPSDQEPA